MRNYGFNYLVEKASIIKEMAQPTVYAKMSQHEGEYFQKFNNIWSAVIKKMAGKSGQASAKRLAIDYVIINAAKAIAKKNIQGSFVGTRTTEYAKENAEKYLSWYKKYKSQKADPKFGPWAQSNYKKEFYLGELIKQNPEIATSEKFQNTLLNDQNIETFLSKPGGYDASLNSTTARFAKKEKEEMFKKELSEILKNQGAAMPLLKQINKMMAKLRKGKWESGNEEFEATQSPSMILADKMLDLSTIMGAKAVESVEKDVSPLAAKAEKESNPKLYFIKNLTKNQISQISAGIQQLIDTKVGIDKEIWRKKAQQIASKTSPIYGEFMLFLLDSAEVEEDQQIDENEHYDGYDSRVLEKVLDSDKKWEIFDEWYSMEKIRREKQNTKQNVDDVGDIGEFNKALDTRLDASATPKTKKIKNKEIDDELEGLSEEEVEDKLRELMANDDPDYDKINAVGKYLKKMKKKIQENYIMNYFTEQIEKDNLTHKHGEFKDRGFKKPVNYAHWLAINES
jgi:hypothetical protein